MTKIDLFALTACCFIWREPHRPFMEQVAYRTAMDRASMAGLKYHVDWDGS